MSSVDYESKHVTFNNDVSTRTIPSRYAVNSDAKQSEISPLTPYGSYADSINTSLEKFITEASCRYMTERQMRNAWNKIIVGSEILPLDMVCVPQKVGKRSFKTSCRFVHGKNCKNPGTSCGKTKIRANSGMICPTDFIHNGKNYKGKWLCKHHMNIINNAIERSSRPRIQCLALVKRRSGNGPSQCENRIMNGSDYCTIHVHKSEEFKAFMRWKEDVNNAANVPLPTD
jgi:hypothetical protein